MTEKQFLSKAINLMKNEKAALNICNHYNKTYTELIEALLPRVQKLNGINPVMKINFTDTATDERIYHVENLNKN